MTTALLVKLSSMGDIFHSFPALSDLLEARPDVQLDWLVEPQFAEIAAWHPAVREVLPLPLRHWLRHRRREDWRAFRAWRASMANRDYDLVLDAQGLVKSALISRCVKASRRHGLSRDSVREGPAAALYQERHPVDRKLHAVTRNRLLFAKSFGYSLPERLNFGIQSQFSSTERDSHKLVFIPGTSWVTKCWSPEQWRRLCRLALDAGYSVEMIWGSEAERQWVEQMHACLPQVQSARQRLSIGQVAEKLVGAAGVVGMDTGFTHLAGALETPAVALYGPTSPERVGLIGGHTANLNLTPALNCMPCHKRRCARLPKHSRDTPPCLAGLVAERVWEQLKVLL